MKHLFDTVRSSTALLLRRAQEKVFPCILLLVAIIQTWVLRYFFQPSKQRSKSIFRRVLVVKLDELGDTAMAWPMLARLKAALPDAKITLLLNKSLVDFWSGLDGIDPPSESAL